jgi:hypothetical protein
MHTYRVGGRIQVVASSVGRFAVEGARVLAREATAERFELANPRVGRTFRAGLKVHDHAAAGER